MEFLQRLLIGAILLLVNFFCLYYNNYALLLLIVVLGGISIYELKDLFLSLQARLSFRTMLVFMAITFLSAFYFRMDYIYLLNLIFVFVLFVKFAFGSYDLLSFTSSLFGYYYIVLSFSSFLLLRGNPLIYLIYLIAWGTDSFAYLFGLVLGKTPLYPKLSPKKTIEGAVGGMIGAAVLSLPLSFFFNYHYGYLVLVALGGSIVSQVGDLCASKLKRISKVKDYGHIFGPHGGVLDRYDSILFVAPYVYLISLIGGVLCQ